MHHVFSRFAPLAPPLARPPPPLLPPPAALPPLPPPFPGPLLLLGPKVRWGGSPGRASTHLRRHEGRYAQAKISSQLHQADRWVLLLAKLQRQGAEKRRNIHAKGPQNPQPTTAEASLEVAAVALGSRAGGACAAPEVAACTAQAVRCVGSWRMRTCAEIKPAGTLWTQQPWHGRASC